MNEYGYYNKLPRDSHFSGISRFDLWVSSVVLALWALALGSGVTATPSIGESILRAVLTLGLFAAAVALFWAAIQWGKPLTGAEPVTVPPQRLHRDRGEDRTDHGARAA